MADVVFFFNDTATTEIYTLSLHDALPIYRITPLVAFLIVPLFGFANAGAALDGMSFERVFAPLPLGIAAGLFVGDRKSTRLNSSHANISYAVFCLKKNKLYDLPSRHGECY